MEYNRKLTFFDIASPRTIHEYQTIWNRKPILKEHGIQWDDLDEHSEYRIQSEGWRRLVERPIGHINETIVREFYARMHSICRNNPPVASITSVNVRGTRVPWQAATINLAYSTPVDFSDNHHYEDVWANIPSGGIPSKLMMIRHEWFSHLGEHNILQYTQNLGKDRKEWKSFLNNRVLYSEDVDRITDEELLLLYAISEMANINWGRLIHGKLIEIIKSPITLSELPYASLISYICTEVAQVHSLSDDIVSYVFPT